MATGAYFNLPAVLLVALVTFVLIVGVNMSATFNAVMVAIKLCIPLPDQLALELGKGRSGHHRAGENPRYREIR